MLPPLTFMIDLIMNLMTGPHHECKKIQHYFSCFESTSELSENELDFQQRFFGLQKPKGTYKQPVC